MEWCRLALIAIRQVVPQSVAVAAAVAAVLVSVLGIPATEAAAAGGTTSSTGPMTTGGAGAGDQRSHHSAGPVERPAGTGSEVGISSGHTIFLRLSCCHSYSRFHKKERYCYCSVLEPNL